MRRAAVTLLALALSAVALAACGRPQAKVQELPAGQLSKDQYVHAFEISANGLAQRYGVSEGGADSKRLVAFQRLLRAWADRLSALHPPPEATRAQVRFVAGVRGFAADLDRARAALDRGDERGAQRLLDSGRIVSAQTRADLVAGRKAFHDLGYDIHNLDKAPVETS